MNADGLKILLIEDETLAAEKLRKLLLEIESEIEIIAVLESVEASVNWLSANAAPDLIFMDIQLEDGIAFEIFDAVKVKAPVIFTTAFDAYAIRAFKVNSVDYLLKPIDKKLLKEAINKYRELFKKEHDFMFWVEKAIAQLAPEFKQRFFIKSGNRFQLVEVDDVVCFYVEERCTFLRTKTGRSYAVDESLDQLQQKLSPRSFFRVSRNSLVQMRYISEIVRYSTNRLKLKMASGWEDGIIVSRNKVSEFKRWLNQ